MVELHIQKNQGITSAIKAELNNQGYDTSKITGNIWSQIMAEVSTQNAQNIQEGRKAIFTGGTDLNGDSHKNFVVKEGIIELAQNIWNKIVSFVTGEPQTVDSPQNSQVDNNAVNINSSNFNTTTNQVKDIILQNVDDIELDAGDKDRIKVYLQEFDPESVPPDVKNDNVSMSEAAFQMMCQATGNPIKAIVVVAQLIENDNRFEDIEINDVTAPASLQGKKFSEVAAAMLNNTSDKIEGAYSEAQGRLVQYLTSNPDIEFASPYDANRKISASELLPYINNIQYRNDNYGTAQAFDFTPDDGINERNGILINTNKFCCNPNLTEADAIKILIHESLHCAFSKEHFPFNNQQEEMYCEQQAIRLTSRMVSASGSEIEDTQTSYGKLYQEFNNMDDSQLNAFLQDNFINRGYANRPKNLDGDVNINGHEVLHGDAIFINGVQVGIIGTNNGNMCPESCIIDQLDKNNINISIPNNGGRVLFTNTPPDGAQPLEIKRGNEVIFTAYFVPMQPN